MEAVLVIKSVSVKLLNFFNGGSIGDQEFVSQSLQLLQWRSIGDQKRICQTLQFLQWRDDWLSRTCLSNCTSCSMEVVLVIKNVSAKLFSWFNGGSIGDQERVCQTLQLLYWTEYWWSRTCLSNSSVSSMEGWLVIKNVSLKLYILFNGAGTGYQERVCQTLQLI